MAIRPTVRLDDDVLDGVRCESRRRGASFRSTLNDLLRSALRPEAASSRRLLKIKPVHMGYRSELNYDCVASLLAFGEGEQDRVT